MSTFLLNGLPFQQGDHFTVIAPELGKLEVEVGPKDFGSGLRVGFSFGFIQTPLACSKYGRIAKLCFYTNGEAYHTLQLSYNCRCPYNVHNHLLTWYGLTIEGNVITAPNLGRHFNQPHNHPLSVGYRVLQQQQELETLYEAPKPAIVLPEPSVNAKGQFQLF